MARRTLLLLAALPGASSQGLNCHAISPAVTDKYCNDNCNHVPPVCPDNLCKCGTGPSPAPIPPPVWPGPPPSPPPRPAPPGPDSGCSADQIKGHCTKCADSKCSACSSGYGVSSHGSCIAACLLPGYVKPAPPSSPGIYNGYRWPDECIDGTEEHFFGIGDWGGLQPGVPANNIHGQRPETQSIDTAAQALVADVMNKRAAVNKPKFVVNVGDNFYWGGIDNKGQPTNYAEHCGDFVEDPKSACSHYRFSQFYNNVYNSPDLNVPWFNVMGNHDWGGYTFETGWDAQFYYTYCPGTLPNGLVRWRMPGFYWRQTVQFRDFAADFYMLDGNFNDVIEGDLMHNICQTTHTASYYPGSCNVPNATMRNEHDCYLMLKKIWEDGVEWMRKEIASSTAEWQIAVIHYPPIWKKDVWYDIANTTGLDLIITGHTHVQNLHMPGAWDNPLKNFTIPWLITGGGGGVTSEGTPDVGGKDDEYGFVDFTINKDQLQIEMMSHGGLQHEDICRAKEVIKPREAPQAAAAPVETVLV